MGWVGVGVMLGIWYEWGGGGGDGRDLVWVGWGGGDGRDLV